MNGNNDAEVDRAKRLMATQASAYAVEITDAATLQAYRDGGVEYVRWISEDDGRTCPTCAERNGVIYPIDEIPAKPHINCRCRVEAVKEDAANAGESGKITQLQKNEKSYLLADMRKKLPPKRYEDITGNWYSGAVPNSHEVADATEITVNGATYKVDGKNVQLAYSAHEKEIAELLEREIGGGEIYMLPKVNNPEHIKTPDYLFNGKFYDLKTLDYKPQSGANRIFNPIARSVRQAENFIIDITNAKLDDNTVKEQIDKIFKFNETKSVNEVVIVCDGKIINVFKRIRKGD